VRPRHRTEAFRRNVEGNHRRLAAVVHDGAGGGRAAGDRRIQRGHAFRQIVAEAADMADRKCLGGSVHREIGVVETVDPGRCDDGTRAGAVERDRQFRLPPEQRKQRDHEPRAVRGKHGQDEFHRVGQLNRDHRIIRQPGFDEMRRQGSNRAIGLGKGQALRRLAGDTRLVERIEQRQRIRLARQDTPEQDVERRRCVSLDHVVHFDGRSCRRHQVSGRYPVNAVACGRSIRFQRAIHCSGALNRGIA